MRPSTKKTSKGKSGKGLSKGAVGSASRSNAPNIRRNMPTNNVICERRRTVPARKCYLRKKENSSQGASISSTKEKADQDNKASVSQVASQKKGKSSEILTNVRKSKRIAAKGYIKNIQIPVIVLSDDDIDLNGTIDLDVNDNALIGWEPCSEDIHSETSNDSVFADMINSQAAHSEMDNASITSGPIHGTRFGTRNIFPSENDSISDFDMLMDDLSNPWASNNSQRANTDCSSNRSGTHIESGPIQRDWESSFAADDDNLSASEYSIDMEIGAVHRTIQYIQKTSQHIIETVAKDNVDTIFVVWHEMFNMDIARSVSGNSENTILFVKKFGELDFDLNRFTSRPVHHLKIYINRQSLVELDVFSFGLELTYGHCKNILFTDFESLERALVRFAKCQDKSITHILDQEWSDLLLQEFKEDAIISVFDI